MRQRCSKISRAPHLPVKDCDSSPALPTPQDNCPILAQPVHLSSLCSPYTKSPMLAIQGLSLCWAAEVLLHAASNVIPDKDPDRRPMLRSEDNCLILGRSDAGEYDLTLTPRIVALSSVRRRQPHRQILKGAERDPSIEGLFSCRFLFDNMHKRQLSNPQLTKASSLQQL